MSEKFAEQLQEDVKNPEFDHIEGEVSFDVLMQEAVNEEVDALLNDLKHLHHELPGEQEVVTEILGKEKGIVLIRQKAGEDTSGHDIIYWQEP